MKCPNIFSNLPNAKHGEKFETILKKRNVLIERIVSKGQCTPCGKWLKGKRGEWVIVLQGRAKLLFKTGKKIITMKVGDYIYIPPLTWHRVEWTDPKTKTIWLAVHLK